MGSALLKVKVRVGNVETTWAAVRRPRSAEAGSALPSPQALTDVGGIGASDSTSYPWDHSLLLHSKHRLPGENKAGAHGFGNLMQWAPVNI